jgi:hypothetical protein
MAKVIFSIQYEINPIKEEEYLDIQGIKKSVQNRWIGKYDVFEVKGKTNTFQEIYEFVSEEAFEAFDDDQNERLNIL